jgi:tetraacyldisaccharide 4'-kinase
VPANPEVDLLVLDDGLQHHALAHDAAVVVFDERGVGNGALLPAGPLREPCPDPPCHWRVLYTAGQRSTPWPGALAQRQISLPGRWPPGMPVTPAAACPCRRCAAAG